MTESLAELYQRPEAQESALLYTRTFRTTIDQAVAEVAQYEPLISSAAALDQLHEDDTKAWLKLKGLVTILPPRVILENYGEETLAWASINAGAMNICEDLLAGLESLAGWDAKTFTQARRWCWHSMSSCNGTDVVAEYRFIEDMPGVLPQVDLETHLRTAARPGVELSDRRLEDYGLIPLRADGSSSRDTGGAIGWYGKEVEPGLEFRVYLDAPSAVALTYKGKPNAVVGVSAEGYNTLMVSQLQGVQGTKIDPAKKKYDESRELGRVSSRGLAPLDWQKLMVGVASDVAKAFDMRDLAIQTGARNYWTGRKLRGDTEPHLTPEEAYRAYDIPAARLGFTKGSDDNWHKPLP